MKDSTILLYQKLNDLRNIRSVLDTPSESVSISIHIDSNKFTNEQDKILNDLLKPKLKELDSMILNISCELIEAEYKVNKQIYSKSLKDFAQYMDTEYE